MPLRARPLDLVLALSFACFALVSFSIDSLTALDVDLARSSWPPARAYYWWAERVEPFLLRPSLYARLTAAVSAFVFGPFYVAAVYAFARGCDWIRLPAVAWAAAILHSLVIWLGVELAELPPRNTTAFWAAYAPYIAVPALVLWRMRKPAPFGN